MKNPNVRQPDESQKDYKERLRKEQGAHNGGVTHMTSHRTVAQSKRAAAKRRNILREKRTK